MMRGCSLVLTAALFGLAAAQSPLDEVNFDGAIESLTIYFKSLAREVLNAEVAEQYYQDSLLNTTTGRLADKFNEIRGNFQEVVNFVVSSSNAVLTALTNGSANSKTIPECCGNTAGPCCHRCHDFDRSQAPDLVTRIANSAEVVQRELDRFLANSSSDPGVEVEFGFSQGVLVRYPESGDPCRLTDSRVQPWYSFAASKPRNVVILIDLSFKVSLSESELLKSSAMDLLYSLNPHDLVRVVVYGTTSVRPPDCYDFIPATADNVRYLSNFISSRKNFPGFAKIASFLNESVNDLNGTSEGSIVVFTSNSSLVYNDVRPMIRDNENTKFTFIFSSDSNIPEDRSLTNLKAFSVLEDVFNPIVNVFELRDTSALQVDWFVTTDRASRERYISFTRPLAKGQTLYGVFHVQVQLAKISTFVNYLSRKPISYFFVTDQNMAVVYHPLAGKGAASSILELERVSELELNFSTTLDFSTTKVFSLPLGPSEKEGILNKMFTVRYTCQHLFNISGAENQPIICAVVESSEERDAIFTVETDTLSNVADHRHIPEEGSCNFFAYKANKELSAVTLSDLLVQDSASTEDLNNFIRNGEGGKVPGHVRVDVAAASQLTESWKMTNEFSNMVTWRFFRSHRGVQATYPAITLPADYNSASTSWYLTGSVPQSGKIRFIPAQRDPLGTGYIYGISKNLKSNSISHGVVAAHLSLGSLLVKIKEVLPACSIHDCSLFDDAGNVIYHTGFDNELPNNVNSLTHMSRYLSHALDEMRSADFCLDYGNPGVLNRHFYNFELLDEKMNSSMTSNACPHFIAQRVPGTNAILAIFTKGQCTSFCTCADSCTVCPVYNYDRVCQCRCSCVQDDEQDSCTMNTDNDRLNGASICPLLRSSTPRYNPVNYGNSLATCPSASCSEITDNRTCVSSASCLQCDSSCRKYTTCCPSRYREGIAACTNPPTVPVITMEPNIVAIVVPVVVVIVLIILILLALVIWYNVRVKGKGDREHHTNVFDFSKDKKQQQEAANGESEKTDKEKEAELEKINETTLDSSNDTKDSEKAEITEQTLHNDTPI